jgi:hypothetical protein
MASKRKSNKHRNFPNAAVKESGSPYTQQVVDRILRVATRGKKLALTASPDFRENLKQRLDGAIRYAVFSREWRERTRTDSELVAMFDKIEKTARGLLLALDVSKAKDDLPIPPWLFHHGLHWQAANDPIAAARVAAGTPAGAHATVVGRSLIRDAVAGVDDIARWAGKARQYLEKKIETTELRAEEESHVPDSAYREWKLEMASIWLDVFARVDTNSRAYGDFVAQSGAAIGLRLDGDAERQREPNIGRIILQSVGKKRTRFTR